MKRAAAGTYPTYAQASKRLRKKVSSGGKPRAGYTSVARTRGAAVTGEMKYFDCYKTTTAVGVVTTTWPAGAMTDPTTTVNLGAAAVATPQCLFAPTVGSGLNQRIGRSVLVRKIKIHGQITAAASAQALSAWEPYLPQKVRLLVVQDQQTNAAQMTAAQLMNDAGAADTTINSYQNPNNFGRFRVLKDKDILIQDPNFVTEYPPEDTPYSRTNGLIRNFKIAINFKVPIKVQFNATNGGTVADIVDNSFHVLCACTGVSTNNPPSISYYSRIAYKE
ncbi:capsid [uncultured virus]|uniref:Capsid n=1 Tax=uncultured virus TaxID=340016 RepID=A0A2K9LUX9_9VIRU|nr:capsid [uncultured virus]